MGDFIYYFETWFEIFANGENILYNSKYKDIFSKLRKLSDYKEEYFLVDEIEWEDHEKHMLMISIEYPDILFRVFYDSQDMREGVNTGNKYFKNGKMQVCKAKLVYPRLKKELLM